EESRDDLQSLGYDTPVPLIRSDSYTTLMDATRPPGVLQFLECLVWRLSGILTLARGDALCPHQREVRYRQVVPVRACQQPIEALILLCVSLCWGGCQKVAQPGGDDRGARRDLDQRAHG
ncbi:hypothetical protein, partial [Mycolicibacterium aubagnense]|uniref:hypothetical protein n=1 Tax=Mycolicibacterium aubagnense TaxID=319707 RepID=UPI001F3464D3